MPTSLTPVTGLAAAFACSLLTAQAEEWVVRSDGYDESPASVGFYEPATARTVIVGGRYTDSSWGWRGVAWERLAPVPTGLGAVSDHAGAYDAARQRGVSFSGFISTNPQPDLFEWDGSVWQRVQPAVSPLGRWSHAMAYDPVRRHVVLFGGGRPFGGFLADTWTWDGTTWTEHTPAVVPPARLGHALAFDERRGRLVLFGGWVGSTFLDDTWEWDGVTWTRMTPATTRPGARSGHQLVWDAARERVLLVGGKLSSPIGDLDLWAWDGVDWLAVAPGGGAAVPVPTQRAEHVAVWDVARERLVVVGGERRNGDVLAETWLWDPVRGWSRSVDATPSARYRPHVVTDTTRDRVVLYGGQTRGLPLRRDDTWTWDGRAWTHVETTRSPGGGLLRIAYDSARDDVVAFAELLPETWLFDGLDWRLARPPTSPPARVWSVLAFDSTRGEVVLFGGQDAQSPIGRADTWVWNGTTWTQRAPAVSPPGRRHALMADDPVRGELVLWGGEDPATGRAFDDTWLWNGTTWRQANPAQRPLPRNDAAIAWDPNRQRVVLLLPDRLQRPYAELDEWDGVTWAPRPATANRLLNHFASALAFDPVRGGLLVVGGSFDAGHFEPDRATWLLTSTPAHVAGYGTGCAGASGRPLRLLANGRPSLGLASFALEVLDAVPNELGLVIGSLGPADVRFGPCTLLHDPAGIVFSAPVSTTGSGYAALGLPIPFDTAFVGAAFYGQAAALDGSAPLGFVLSGGLEVRLGD